MAVWTPSEDLTSIKAAPCSRLPGRLFPSAHEGAYKGAFHSVKVLCYRKSISLRDLGILRYRT